MGKAAAAELARMGATVVIVCRNEEKGDAAASEIRKKTQNSSVEFLAADLSSQAQVRRVAAEFRAKYPALDVLINNAGVYSPKRLVSEDGIEMTFAVNHLAHFLLTHLLLDLMKSSPPARIVNVSSEAHQSAPFDFENLQGQKNYSGFAAYRVSKLCNLFFTFELARRLQGISITANALHPGVVHTGIFRNTPAILRMIVKFFGQDPQKGSETITFLASSSQVEHVSGKYFIKKAEARPSALALDAENARRLWDLSLRMTHLT